MALNTITVMLHYFDYEFKRFYARKNALAVKSSAILAPQVEKHLHPIYSGFNDLGHVRSRLI